MGCPSKVDEVATMLSDIVCLTCDRDESLTKKCSCCFARSVLLLVDPKKKTRKKLQWVAHFKKSFVQEQESEGKKLRKRNAIIAKTGRCTHRRRATSTQ